MCTQRSSRWVRPCLRLVCDRACRALAIIPQDPVLFSGTLRFNLDPFGSYQQDSEGNQDDSQLWNVLETCQLKETIEGKEGKLDHVRALSTSKLASS